MSVDGLRAWIGEVERKLGMRTRVFLVLSAIAIGGAATGIYLALDAASESISKDEVAALREQVGAAGSAGTATEATEVTALKAEIEALRNQVSALESKGGSSGPGSQKGTSSKPERQSEDSPSASKDTTAAAGGKASPPDKDEAAASAKSGEETE